MNKTEKAFKLECPYCPHEDHDGRDCRQKIGRGFSMCNCEERRTAAEPFEVLLWVRGACAYGVDHRIAGLPVTAYEGPIGDEAKGILHTSRGKFWITIERKT